MALWSISIRRGDAKCHAERGGGGGEGGRWYKVLRSRVNRRYKKKKTILYIGAPSRALQMYLAEYWLFLCVYVVICSVMQHIFNPYAHLIL